VADEHSAFLQKQRKRILWGAVVLFVIFFIEQMNKESPSYHPINFLVLIVSSFFWSLILFSLVDLVERLIAFLFRQKPIKKISLKK
jgi:hypothetical protein